MSGQIDHDGAGRGGNQGHKTRLSLSRLFAHRSQQLLGSDHGPCERGRSDIRRSSKGPATDGSYKYTTRPACGWSTGHPTPTPPSAAVGLPGPFAHAHAHPALSPSPATSAQSSPGPAEPVCLPPSLLSVQPSPRSRRVRDASDSDTGMDVDVGVGIDVSQESGSTRGEGEAHKFRSQLLAAPGVCSARHRFCAYGWRERSSCSFPTHAFACGMTRDWGVGIPRG